MIKGERTKESNHEGRLEEQKRKERPVALEKRHALAQTRSLCFLTRSISYLSSNLFLGTFSAPNIHVGIPTPHQFDQGIERLTSQGTQKAFSGDSSFRYQVAESGLLFRGKQVHHRGTDLAILSLVDARAKDTLDVSYGQQVSHLLPSGTDVKGDFAPGAGFHRWHLFAPRKFCSEAPPAAKSLHPDRKKGQQDYQDEND